MRVIVTGSRAWSDFIAVFAALDEVVWDMEPDEALTIVHGGCPSGADHFARKWAGMYGAAVEVFPADWAGHGRRAGPLRNERMIKAGADLVLAFPMPGGRGTQHTMQLAERAGIPVKVVGQDG